MKNKNGFTLVEVLLTITLVSIVILGAANLVIFSIKGHKLTSNEFDIQSNLRNVSQKVNIIVRDTSATYLLHRENADNLTDEWNYIMLSPEKDRLLNYEWNPATSSHDVKELFPAIEGVTLDIILNKDSAPHEDRLLEFGITVNGAGETRTIDTQIEAKNSLQIVDRSYLEEPNVLAYRNDSRLDEVSNAQAVVSMVLDKSGSMGNRMNGYSNVNNSHSNPSYHSRMKLMKQEATRMIEELADLPNVNISINPFDSTANGSYAMVNAKTQLDVLKNRIDGLSANGGTNTGDGIRRGFYRIKEFNELSENINKTNKNFMIILVDGVTTFASVHNASVEHQGYLEYNAGNIFYYNDNMYTYYYNSWGRYYYRYINPISYVVGNDNINNSEADTNTTYSSGRYFGFGSDLDPYGKAYVDLIGEMVQSYKEGTNEEIKVYVIGFSAVPADYGSLRDIALATTNDTVYYEAGSSEALEEIFKAIQRDISDALWHIGGPN